MTDFTWDFCPRCQATGTVLDIINTTGGPIGTSRPCEACDGLGRVKVPVGFQLVPKPVYTVTTEGSTNSLTTTATG